MPTALIIGGSRGIGRALVKEFLDRRWQVLATARNLQSLAGVAEDHKDDLETVELEMTDRNAVSQLSRALRDRSIDLLFVSAGIFGPVGCAFGDLDDAMFEDIMRVNVLAPLRIVEAFLDMVPRSGTVAVMSSEVASGGQNTGTNFEPYRMSKGALNLGFRSIAARFEPEGRTYLAMNPGWVKTDMGGDDAPLTAEESARGIVDAILQRRGTGEVSFVDYQNILLPW